MSSSEVPVAKRKKLPLAKLAVAGGVLALIGAVLVYFVGWQTLLSESLRIKTELMGRVSAAGPWIFFGAMAVLPAFGMPMLTFALTAGPLFGERLGFFAVTCYGIMAITFNLTVTYWLARKWLRPLFTKLLARFGYQLPKVESGDVTDLIVLLRVTPGVPFFAQNYLLGLAEAPFLRYMVISCAIQWSFNTGFILFGDALNQGQGKTVMLAVMVLVALTVGTHLVRKHYGKKKTPAASGGRKMKTREETLFAGDAGPEVESVSDFTRRVKTLLETGIRPGWVRGEVTNLRAQASGHVYFSLKDAGAQLSAVMFRGDAARQTVKLREGVQVVAYGEVSVYEARGQYQLIVRAVIEDGVGKLQREFEALKARLAAEGLFAMDKKRTIPAMPACVGFVTSPTGAAVQDFLRIVIRRGWRGRVVVLPAKVQGEGAAAEMAAMLALAQELKIFDVIVIGRGGGSLEDLWAFNEETLVRAVAACTVPVISAVGHEIDFTLCDFAADVRAETPSAAAELISSEFVASAERAAQADEAMTMLVENAVARAGAELDHARSRLRLLSPAAQVEQGFLRLDDFSNRLGAALRSSTQMRRQQLAEARARLMHATPQTRVEQESQRLLSLWKRLQAASPASVLNRGFAIMRDEAGKPVVRRAGVKPGQALTAEFADGSAKLRAE